MHREMTETSANGKGEALDFEANGRHFMPRKWMTEPGANYSDDLKDLVYECMYPEMHKRPSAEDLLARTEHFYDHYFKKARKAIRTGTHSADQHKVYFSNAAMNDVREDGTAIFKPLLEQSWDVALFGRVRHHGPQFSDPDNVPLVPNHELWEAFYENEPRLRQQKIENMDKPDLLVPGKIGALLFDNHVIQRVGDDAYFARRGGVKPLVEPVQERKRVRSWTAADEDAVVDRAALQELRSRTKSYASSKPMALLQHILTTEKHEVDTAVKILRWLYDGDYKRTFSWALNPANKQLGKAVQLEWTKRHPERPMRTARECLYFAAKQGGAALKVKLAVETMRNIFRPEAYDEDVTEPAPVSKLHNMSRADALKRIRQLRTMIGRIMRTDKTVVPPYDETLLPYLFDSGWVVKDAYEYMHEAGALRRVVAEKPRKSSKKRKSRRKPKEKPKGKPKGKKRGKVSSDDQQDPEADADDGDKDNDEDEVEFGGAEREAKPDEDEEAGKDQHEDYGNADGDEYADEDGDSDQNDEANADENADGVEELEGAHDSDDDDPTIIPDNDVDLAQQALQAMGQFNPAQLGQYVQPVEGRGIDLQPQYQPQRSVQGPLQPLRSPSFAPESPTYYGKSNILDDALDAPLLQQVAQEAGSPNNGRGDSARSSSWMRRSKAPSPPRRSPLPQTQAVGGGQSPASARAQSMRQANPEFVPRTSRQQYRKKPPTRSDSRASSSSSEPLRANARQARRGLASPTTHPSPPTKLPSAQHSSPRASSSSSASSGSTAQLSDLASIRRHSSGSEDGAYKPIDRPKQRATPLELFISSDQRAVNKDWLRNQLTHKNLRPRPKSFDSIFTASDVRPRGRLTGPIIPREEIFGSGAVPPQDVLVAHADDGFQAGRRPSRDEMYVEMNLEKRATDSQVEKVLKEWEKNPPKRVDWEERNRKARERRESEKKEKERREREEKEGKKGKEKKEKGDGGVGGDQ